MSKQYVISSQAWYAHSAMLNGAIEEVTFGNYNPEEGSTGEGTFRWYRLGTSIGCKLEIFDDAWAMLNECPSLLMRLASYEKTCIDSATLEEVCRILEECGFADGTPRKTPCEVDDVNNPAHPCHY